MMHIVNVRKSFLKINIYSTYVLTILKTLFELFYFYEKEYFGVALMFIIGLLKFHETRCFKFFIIMSETGFIYYVNVIQCWQIKVIVLCNLILIIVVSKRFLSNFWIIIPVRSIEEVLERCFQRFNITRE